MYKNQLLFSKDVPKCVTWSVSPWGSWRCPSWQCALSGCALIVQPWASGCPHYQKCRTYSERKMSSTSLRQSVSGFACQTALPHTLQDCCCPPIYITALLHQMLEDKAWDPTGSPGAGRQDPESSGAEQSSSKAVFTREPRDFLPEGNSTRL